MAELGPDPRSGEHRLAMLRERQLKEAFNRVDTDGSGDISLEEVLRYLRSVSDEVEEAYVREVFERLDTNRNGKVSIEEFVEGYVMQVNLFSKDISALKLTLQQREEARSRKQLELAASKESEKKNAWGIMEGSKLYVRVLEAQKLNARGGKPNSFVEVMCERQRVQSGVAKENRNPAWGEMFEFAVQIGNGEILFNVIHQGRDMEFLGRCSMPLAELRDQQTIQRWMTLLDEKGQETQSRLQVALQWIHSQTALLTEELSSLNTEVSNIQAEIARVEAELQKLGTSPMGLFERETALLQFERDLISRVDKFTEKHFTVRGM